MRIKARKRVFAAALSLVAADIGSTAVVPQASAHPVGSLHVSTRFAPDRTINHQGDLSEVALTIQDNGVNATAIGAIPEVSFFGHMQFFGPKGFNKNSPDGERQFSPGRGGAVPIDPPRLAPIGSKWCVQLWEFNGNETPLGAPNCVTVS